MKIEKRIEALGLTLPSPEKPGALYVPVKQSGNLLFLSGQVPMRAGEPVYTGKIGLERSVEYGKSAAEMCVMNMLAALKHHLGDLDKIKEIVKLQIFVSSETGFDQQHIVGNAASTILIDIFGESGKHARTAIGTNQLPMDFSVEIEGIIEIGDDY